ncbi:MAG: beta-ketoacyl-[acyl-carrier-protein] synthase family protein [Marinilabiliales bacterium]
MNRVVITGIGVVSPIGNGTDQFLENIKQGKTGISIIEELKNFGFSCHVGGKCDISNSKWLDTLDKYGLTPASDVIRFAIIAALEAWANAGLEIPYFYDDNVDYDTGCIIGSGISSVDILGNKIVPFTNERKIKKLRSTIVEHSMVSGPSANLSGILALGNYVSFNSSACATGTEAIILGYEHIKHGKAKRMIVGGSDAYSPYGWAGFDAMRVLSTKYNNHPEKSSRPLSATADGFVPGSGAGILILEDYEFAIKRNATILAEICGAHINAGGQRQSGTMTAPNPAGVIKCIKNAINDAGINSNKIDYVSGHLSATMADIIEVKNWAEALNRHGKDFPYINSLKALTGHCIGAAGALETIATLLSMNNNFIYPSVNSDDLHPEIEKTIDRNCVPLNTINTEINYAIKASFGFGDVNSCLILKNIKS